MRVRRGSPVEVMPSSWVRVSMPGTGRRVCCWGWLFFVSVRVGALLPMFKDSPSSCE